MGGWTKVSEAKATDGDGSFTAKEVFDVLILSRGELAIRYELTCGTDKYVKRLEQNIIVFFESMPTDFECGLKPVIWAPSGDKFTKPFNFGNNFVGDLTPNLEDKFDLRIEDDGSCGRRRYGHVAYMALQTKEKISYLDILCLDMNSCMTSSDKYTCPGLPDPLVLGATEDCTFDD